MSKKLLRRRQLSFLWLVVALIWALLCLQRTGTALDTSAVTWWTILDVVVHSWMALLCGYLAFTAGVSPDE